jgi:LDH2 family malate/lactate/ureidoglycolate dehydrogenase
VHKLKLADVSSNSLDDFKERMDYLYQRVVTSEKAKHVERIYFPGELEQLTAEERLKSGIPYSESEITALNNEADKVGVGHIESFQSFESAAGSS